MPDYSKGKIYTIRCLNDPNVYVGSTIQSLAVRMGKHRIAYKKNEVLGLNKDIVIDINDWKIELHELYPCNTKLELHRREGEIIRQLGTLNKTIAGRTNKEYRNDNSEMISLRQKNYAKKNEVKIKEYQEKNKELFKENHKKWINNNTEKIKKTTKIYFEKNEDKIKEYNKNYKEINREKHIQYMKEYHLKKKSNLIIKEDE
jgi:hypothetical protein